MEFHEATVIFPLMAGAQFDGFKADIEKHGVREPVVVHEGKLLDGRNRYRACQKLGIECPSRIWNGEGNGDPLDYVVSVNLHRRQLTGSQRAMVAGRLWNLKHAEAKERQRLSPGRPKKVSSCDDTFSVPPRKPGHRGLASEAAGKALGVSPASVDRARTVIASKIPEVIQAVDDGCVTVARAAKLVKLPRSFWKEEIAGGKRLPLPGKVAKRKKRKKCPPPPVEIIMNREGWTLMDRLNELLHESYDNWAACRMKINGKTLPKLPEKLKELCRLSKAVRRVVVAVLDQLDKELNVCLQRTHGQKTS